MNQKKRFFSRELRFCYWDSDKSLMNSVKCRFEAKLKNLPITYSLTALKTLQDPNFSPCDLLLVSATQIPENLFSTWLKGIHGQIAKKQKIWTPALILNDSPLHLSDDLIEFAVYENWYFDVLQEAHMASLPIRVANLLKIHDHLFELTRYNQQIEAIDAKLALLEDQLESLQPRKK